MKDIISIPGFSSIPGSGAKYAQEKASIDSQTQIYCQEAECTKMVEEDQFVSCQQIIPQAEIVL